HHGPAVDPGAAEDEVGGSEALELVGLIVGGNAGNLADLVEAARVRELADALADGEAAAVALPLHSLAAAPLLPESLPPPHRPRPAPPRIPRAAGAPPAPAASPSNLRADRPWRRG